MNQTKENEEMKIQMTKSYHNVIADYETNKQIWRSFPLTSAGDRDKKLFSIRTDFSPGRRPETPAMKAFESLRSIWSSNNEWPGSTQEKKCRQVILLSPDAPEWAYHTSALDGNPWEEAEEIIAKDPWWAFEYAQDIVGPGNDIIESGVMKNAHYTYLYARFVVKGQFVKGESTIARDAMASINYAKHVLRKRFPQGEKAIFGPATEYFEWCEKVGSKLDPAELVLQGAGN